MSERTELKGYTPGPDVKDVLRIAEQKGLRKMRYAGGSNPNLELAAYPAIVQAERDDKGKWHFYQGEQW